MPEAEESALPAPALAEGAIWLLHGAGTLPAKIQWQRFFDEWVAGAVP